MADAGTLKFRGERYPKRRGDFFALKFLRLLSKSGAVQFIGSDGYMLLSAIVLIEDKLRYSRAVAFSNDALCDRHGWKRDKLMRVRSACVDQGWLCYERGSKGKPGVYWVVVPDWVMHDDDDGDEITSQICDRKPTESPTENQRNPGANTEPFLPKPKDPPPPPTDAVVAVIDKLLEAKLGKSAETVSEALSNGQSLDQITAVIDYWSSRPHAWGPGALRNRLILKSASNLPIEEGWPKPDVREKQLRDSAAVAESSRLLREKQQRDREADQQSRTDLEQLELQFGDDLDRLTRDKQERLIADRPFLLPLFRRHGPHAATVRPELLRAFAETKCLSGFRLVRTEKN